MLTIAAGVAIGMFAFAVLRAAFGLLDLIVGALWDVSRRS